MATQVKSGMISLVENFKGHPFFLTVFGCVGIGYFYQTYLNQVEGLNNAFASAEALRVCCLSVATIISAALISRAITNSVTMIWGPKQNTEASKQEPSAESGE